MRSILLPRMRPNDIIYPGIERTQVYLPNLVVSINAHFGQGTNSNYFSLHSLNVYLSADLVHTTHLTSFVENIFSWGTKYLTPTLRMRRRAGWVQNGGHWVGWEANINMWHCDLPALWGRTITNFTRCALLGNWCVVCVHIIYIWQPTFWGTKGGGPRSPFRARGKKWGRVGLGWNTIGMITRYDLRHELCLVKHVLQVSSHILQSSTI